MSTVVGCSLHAGTQFGAYEEQIANAGMLFNCILSEITEYICRNQYTWNSVVVARVQEHLRNTVETLKRKPATSYTHIKSMCIVYGIVVSCYVRQQQQHTEQPKDISFYSIHLYQDIITF